MMKEKAPIVFEAGGLFLKIEYRRSRDDEGITIDVLTGKDGTGPRLLRFDCFKKNPHAHFGPSGADQVLDMRKEGISDPLSWTLTQLRTRLPAMIRKAGYEEIARTANSEAVAEALAGIESRLTVDVLYDR